MTYRLPDNLAVLRTWLAKQGADDFKTERQCAFMAQQLARTRLKFPPKGQSCMRLLEAIQKALPAESVQSSAHITRASSMAAIARSSRKVATRGKGDKVGQVRQTFDVAVPLGLVLYCDGACEPNPGIGGWGVAIYRDGLEIDALSGGDAEATNQTMELTAAIKALTWFAERGVVEPVRIISDSMYVVNGCNDWRHGWKAKGWKRGGPNANGKNSSIANLELWQELDRLLTLVPIRLEWVKGHAGVIGNERADELSLIGREAILQAPAATAIERQLAYAI